MPLFVWKPEYSVGIGTIDAQHKKLVDLINELHEAMSAGKSRDVLGKILGDLVAYTKTHFTFEEELMRKFAYPEFPRHKKEHDVLTEQVLVYQKQFDSGKLTLSLEVMNFLKEWLATHITGTDKLYTQFFVSKGVK